MQNSLLARVGEAVWGWPMMALFLGTGIWYFMTIELLIAYRHDPFVFPKKK